MSKTKRAAVVSVLTGVCAILVGGSPGYAGTTPGIVSDTFSTPENVTLHVTAPGVAAGGTDTSGIVFYQFGAPSAGTFQGLTTIDGLPTSSANGGFAFVPPSGFTGTVNFIVQGVTSNTPFNGGGSFNGVPAVTDHIVVTAATPTTGVAETPTFALFVGGLAALGLLRWRRKRTARAAP